MRNGDATVVGGGSAGPCLWYACALGLEAQRDGIIPPTHGQQLHGLFLQLVQGVDPALAQALHAGSSRRPFTIAPLRGLPGPQAEGHVVRAGTCVALRITLLDSAVFGGFLAALLGEGAVRQVRLGTVPFTVRRVATAPDQHPDAGTANPARLLRDAGACRAITLRFLTPTAFSLGNRPAAGKVIEPLPRPDLVFGGLLSAWNAFGGPPLAPDLRRLIAERMVIARFELRSASFRFRDHVQVGAVGSCTYDIKGEVASEALRSLNALADAAVYLGVGYRTTMGMGQARREQAASRPAAGPPETAAEHG